MSDTKSPMHFVCTWDEAAALIAGQKEFWVCNCGCREGNGGCARSRMDLCITFDENGTVTGSDHKKITLREVDSILEEARQKYLVCRPFRDEATRTTLEGICFCCDDCCSYFLNPNETCDKGKYIEATDMRRCTHCGDCIDICYFKARAINDDVLLVNSDKCYGCGLCVASCPIDCIEMIARA